jgi:hydrogenase maturation protease
MHTLIVGLGNPILGDDGVGWRIAEQVASRLPVQALLQTPANPGFRDEPVFAVECLGLGGLSLMEHLIGYDRAILIDTIVTGENPTGTVSCFFLEELPDLAAGHLTSAHDTTLQNALKVGQAMGAKLPEVIIVVTVETQCVYDFSEDLSPAVAASIPIAVQTVMENLI